ncbi:MAG: hypothetical protein RLZZ196_3494 [Bacteroidota bacterium]|jgi:cysteinyl-tRNA synthetase
MILNELNNNKQRKLNQLLESRFGAKINFSKLSIEKAERLQENITHHLKELRMTQGTANLQKNPKYMEMLVVREGLTAWIDNRRKLLEGNLEAAEVALAAKDMVDSLQNMIEDASKMLNEQLPPLIDTIRDQLGQEQADSYQGMSSGALQTLLDNLKSARESLDQGARLLAGDETAAMGGMGDTASPMSGTNLPPPELGDGDLPPELAQSDAAVGGSKPMGRAKR